MYKNYDIDNNDWVTFNEPRVEYVGNPLNDITYKIIGACFDVHNELGRGFSEVVYKDAVEYEFRKRGILFEREKKFTIKYKDVILPHYYFADFIVEREIILEIKANSGAIDNHFKQVINYLAVSNSSIGLLINFGEQSLKYKRLILTK